MIAGKDMYESQDVSICVKIGLTSVWSPLLPAFRVLTMVYFFHSIV